MTTPKKILIQDLELSDKEIKRLREENRKLKAELEKFSESYKRYRDFEKQELADSLYDMGQENKTLNKEVEYRKDEFKKLKKELKAKKELLRYYQKKS